MADQASSGAVQGAVGRQSMVDEHGNDSIETGPHVEPGDLTEAHAGAAGKHDSLAKHESFHGRPVSWVSTVIIVIGFALGGIGLCAGPLWWTLWAGGAIVVVGGILGMATGIFNDWY